MFLNLNLQVVDLVPRLIFLKIFIDHLAEVHSLPWLPFDELVVLKSVPMASYLLFMVLFDLNCF